MTISQGASDSGDIPQLLRWIGMAFIGVFLVTTVTSLYPFALLQPLWQLRMADSLMNGASLPLMGAVMIVLSTRFSERSGPHKLLGAIRRLALVATIGFLLLVPLQIVASVTTTRATLNQATAAISQAMGDVEALSRADSRAAMDAVLARMPANVREAEARLAGDTFETRRDQLVDLLRPQLQTGRANNVRLARERWFSVVLSAIRFSLCSLFWAIGFAALTGPTAAGPSLLSRVLGIRQTLANRRARAAAVTRPARPARKDSAEQIERWKEAKRLAAQRDAAKRDAARRDAARRQGGRKPASRGGKGGLFGGRQAAGPSGSSGRPVAPEWFEGQDDQQKDGE